MWFARGSVGGLAAGGSLVIAYRLLVARPLLSIGSRPFGRWGKLGAGPSLAAPATWDASSPRPWGQAPAADPQADLNTPPGDGHTVEDRTSRLSPGAHRDAGHTGRGAAPHAPRCLLRPRAGGGPPPLRHPALGGRAPLSAVPPPADGTRRGLVNQWRPPYRGEGRWWGTYWAHSRSAQSETGRPVSPLATLPDRNLRGLELPDDTIIAEYVW
eukprot:SM000077S21617  [mRNA]  locus=s77:594454:595289:+ [translate_table: standard]